MADNNVATSDMLQRIDADFARYRTEFQRTRDDVLQITSDLTNLKTFVQNDISDLKSSINALATKLEEKSKTNWPAVALAISMVPALWLFVTTYTANAISPTNSATALNSEEIKRINGLQNTLQQEAAASTAADVNSRSDRAQLNERIQKLETTVSNDIADRRAAAAATKVSLAEIEGQFHALSNLDNLRAAQQERLNSLLWEKSHPGERYPNGTFFPTSIFQGPNGNNNASGP